MPRRSAIGDEREHLAGSDAERPPLLGGAPQAAVGSLKGELVAVGAVLFAVDTRITDRSGTGPAGIPLGVDRSTPLECNQTGLSKWLGPVLERVRYLPTRTPLRARFSIGSATAALSWHWYDGPGQGDEPT